MTVPTVDQSANPNKDDLAVGDDTLHGDAGEDVVIGDHGVITQADPAVALWTTAHSAINRIESAVIGEGGDDIIYGGDQADILIGGSNTLNGTRGGDAIDGGADDDLIFGDNVVLEHRAAGAGQTADPRLRTLDGTEIYVTGGPDDGEVAPNSSVDSGHPQVTASWAEYLITDLNHSASIETAGDRNFGDDYIAGGADDDTIFGQLGDDVIQGDGSIGDGISDRVGASRDETTGALTVNASTEAVTDGDDYIEGNGGNDVIFGNLGQDDIVGGSSSLFTLVDANLRPDGSDMLFGGSGLRIERNYQVPAGDIVMDAVHAEDSDAIAGDNANIYRLVGTNGNDTRAFLSFQYDAGRGNESIIVRAVDLLDYTPGGSDYDPVNTANDIGAGDEIHGEAGDDFVYGMRGSDLLFGDSEDDDLIGGYGNDWISGGAGSDGVLGDDGRIYTSRNTQAVFDGQVAEPLYGIAALAETDVEISTPGNAQQAIINVSGELKKTVNLTPFNVDALEDNLYDAQHADDIIFGGLGDDFLHGGSGDDAISGAEAIASGFAVLYPAGSPSDANRSDGIVMSFGFDNPVNPGNILGYSALRAGEFAEYDEFNPRVRIVDANDADYFLNFNSDEGLLLADGSYSDGDDAIFGDLGNDWIVGGTGRDNMYGGRGDDLLNGDDYLATNGGLNDTTDTAERYGDRAFGGAGRDVMIANTGADRLIDWAGEFNTYLVPFAIFGPPTVSRALPPSLFDFLYDLSASDGADLTRAADEGSTNDGRNGEPFGELGLVTQKDFDWQAQTGAPADVQPGNIPGGERDVVQQATFNQGTSDAFLADTGTWSVENSRLQVAPEALGEDAVSVYYVNDILPSYFELQATIQAVKPTGGYKSNSYLIFDYQSPTDFKFAGVNISTDKIEMGHRDENGWHVAVQTPSKLRPDRDYNLLLAINGTTATLLVNNSDFMTHTYDARVDDDGFSYGLNSGLLGIGATNSKASIDNVKVQVLPRDVMPVRQNDFESGPADFLSGTSVGQWSLAGGYMVGDASVDGLSTAWGGNIAYTTSDVRIAAGQVLEIETTLKRDSTGGVVFDQYGESDFKFVFIDANGVVSIGHQSGSSWAIEASAAMPAQVKGDYDIKVSLVGSTVNVIIDNQTVVSHAYNALTGDGAIGLLASGDNVSFDDIVISTNDPAYLDAVTGDALRATGDAASTPGITLEDGVNLQPILDAAVGRWSERLNRSLPGADDLAVWVTDLPDDLLGLTVGDIIYVDRDAAGLGWYVDPTPEDDSEFDMYGDALPGTDAANGVDMLSVIAHEVGHVLGYDHDAMQAETLSIGTRIVPEHRDTFSDEPLYRFRDFAGEFLDSVVNARDRIVPVNLGMFESVHRQIPWAFRQDTQPAGSDPRAMIWNEEAGEFERERPAKPAAKEDGRRHKILEFLDETGDWIR
jgi:Ca2+-binding RTX toxin-like protein